MDYTHNEPNNKSLSTISSSKIKPSAKDQTIDPEVKPRKPRRKLTAAYKLEILKQADACTEPGEIGALLRREGLYTSSLSTWRKERASGLLKALSPQKRGPKSPPKNPLADELSRLERENAKLQAQLQHAELIIDAQKKVSQIFGIALNQELPKDQI